MADDQDRRMLFGKIPVPKIQIIAGKENIEKAKAEQDDEEPITFWWLLTRFSPVWLLLLAIVLIEPRLPFRAVGAVIDTVSEAVASEPAYRAEPVYIVEGGEDVPDAALPPPNWDLEIAPIFTEEVQYWEEGIGVWSEAYRVKPNMIATIMQIESCGNPEALSGAGAQGLFQVLDLHFQEGEDPFDPETNARRGMLFFGDLLAATNGDVGLAFAAYNAGPSVIDRSPVTWPQETQNYQYWASGIYDEAEAGFQESPTLIEWLEAGGSSLCAQAADELGLE